MNVAVTFEDTVSLGTLVVMFLIGTAGALGVIYGGRYRVAYEAASAAATELRQALSDAHDRLGQALRELADARQVIERYEALPNMERVITLMVDTAERQDARAATRAEDAVKHLANLIENHELRAAERQNKTVAVLNDLHDNLQRLKGEQP